MKAEERKREKYLPTLLVQQIRLQWYKDCRGGNAAAQRNQYPRAMRLPKDFFSYYSFGLPTHFASIVQRPDGFRIDRDCRRLMEWKPNGTMRLHPFELIQQEHGIHVRYRNDWHIGAMPERYTYDSPEETKARLDAWMRGSKEILRQWITDKRYRELISCAHGGWYQDDVIFEPLAEHFVANHLFDELRFLCERGIRFSAEDMLATIKSEKEEHGTLDIETIRSIDVPSYVSGRSYSHLGEIAKYRKRTLDQIIRYAGYLEQIHAPAEYLEQVNVLQESVSDLTIKTKDLKPFRFRL